MSFPKPSTVSCFQAFHQVIVEDSGYRVCTILAHPQEPTTFPVHIISYEATALPDSILKELHTFLSKLGHQPFPDQDTEDGLPELEADSSDQISDSLDAMERELEEELEIASEEDPATKAFQSDEKEYHNAKALAPDPASGAELKEIDAVDVGATSNPPNTKDLEDKMPAFNGEDLQQSWPDNEFANDSVVDADAMSHSVLKGQHTSHILHSDEEYFDKGSLAPDPASEVAIDVGTASSLPNRKEFAVLNSDEDLQPQGEPQQNWSGGHPSLKRQRMAYVLVPPVRSLIPRYTHHSKPASPAAVPLLNETEWCNVPFDKAVMLGYTYAAFKYIIGIDLDNVPGRTRKESNPTGCYLATPPKHVQDCEAVPIANKLVDDEDLKTLGCAYLPDYGVIICQNLHGGKQCRQGVTLQRLFPHCYNSHRVPFCKKTGKKYSLAQRSLIARLLHRFPNIIAADSELRNLEMRPDQFGPIPHIAEPSDGYICSQCGFVIHLTTKRIHQHWQQHDPQHAPRRYKGNIFNGPFRRCKVQTFSSISSTSMRWLAVPPHHPSQSTSSRTPGLQLGSAGAILAAALTHSSHTSFSINRIVTLPFFINNRAVDLIERISPSLASTLLTDPKKSEKILFKLKMAMIERYKMLCKGINNAPTLVREMLVVPKSGERRLIKKFNSPMRPSTITMYGLEEVYFLCFVIRCIKQGLYRLDLVSPWEGGEFYLVLTTGQFNLIQDLLTLVQQQHFLSEELQRAIDATLYSLYLPSNCFEILKEPYLSPVASFICIRSIHPDGGFYNPKRLTSLHAKMQFSIRLLLLAEAQKLYEARNQGDGDSDAKYEEYMANVRSFIIRWATEDNVSPLAIVRQWIRGLSPIARLTPTSATILWDPGYLSISVKNHLVSIADYKKHVRDSLAAVIEFVDSRVLFGFNFSDSAYALPTEDNNNVDTRGYGLFSSSSEAIAADNDHPSSRLLTLLCKAGSVCSMADDRVLWDPKNVSTWLLNISEAWSRVAALLLLLSLPARGTEAIMWQHTNSQSSPRHLFYSPVLKTLVSQSSYNKTTAMTGLHKYIIRAIPHALATVIAKLLRIIRPVETFAVISQAPALQRDAIISTYETFMFVSAGKVWTNAHLSATLRHWFLEKLNVPFGLNLHRHFAQAVQRKFHSYKDNNQLADTANKSLGHGRQVGDVNYGRENCDVSLNVSDREKFEEVGSNWITWHGVAV